MRKETMRREIFHENILRIFAKRTNEIEFDEMGWNGMEWNEATMQHCQKTHCSSNNSEVLVQYLGVRVTLVHPITLYHRTLHCLPLRPHFHHTPRHIQPIISPTSDHDRTINLIYIYFISTLRSVRHGFVRIAVS